MANPLPDPEGQSPRVDVVHAACAEEFAASLPPGRIRIFKNCPACMVRFRAGDEIVRITFGEDEFDYMHLDCAQKHPMNAENQAAGAQCAAEGQIDSTSASSETSR